MRFQRVLIALDDSALAAHAVDVGIALTRALGAEAALVHVVDPKLAYVPDSGIPAARIMADLKREGHALLEAAVARTPDAPPLWQFLREGGPPHEIIAAAREWNADLIVLGAHGRSGFRRMLLGNTAEAVLRHAPCPVVAVRAHEAGPAPN